MGTHEMVGRCDNSEVNVYVLACSGSHTREPNLETEPGLAAYHSIGSNLT